MSARSSAHSFAHVSPCLPVPVCQGYGKELKEGLITLQKENKGTMISDPFYSAYHHSHPPLLQRLQAIDNLPHAKKVQ